MSYTYRGHVNIGAYESPYSGVGIEFDPLGVTPDKTGLTLHEAGFLRENSSWNFPGVFSPFWRLYYNSMHGHSVLFGDRHVNLEPDRILLIPDHQLFHCLGEQPVPTFWLAFSLTRQLALSQKIPIILSPTNIELSLINELSRLIEDNKQWNPSERIQKLSTALLLAAISRSEIKWQEELPERMQLLIEYIADNVQTRISNKNLAKYAGISIEGVIRIFKKHLGTTPAAYVTQVRVRTASQLLIQTETSIEEIASTLSFPNRAYFSRTFKKVTGQSPAAFRKKQLLNKSHHDT